ncbi:MAG: DUF3987 domain-containing protein [Planctomycetes bacterium]|nr:DUF3987 domain-containing protein [Planctomycetota bacterium]
MMDLNDGRTIDTKKARRMPDEFEPFPVEFLPEPIRSYIVDGAEALGCDPAFIIIPMLSILASSIGNSRCVKLKGTWTEPAILWTAVIGESGAMKTPAISYAMQPLKKMQLESFRDYDEKMVDYNESKRQYDQDMKKRKKSDPLPDEPREPVANRYFCNDTTIEALAAILNTSPRGILQSCDELSGWMNSFNSYKGGKGSDEARWLEMYNAGMLLVDRKSGTPRTIRIPNASVSICGGIQPDILRRSLTREYYESGIVARFLMAMPPRQPKVWRDADVSPLLIESVEVVFRKLVELQMDDDGIGGFKAKPLSLNPAAQDLWVAFYNDHGIEQAELSGDLAAVWSKLEATASRLALIIHCVRAAAGDPDLASEDYIDSDSIAAGVLIVQWFKAELKRIYVVLSEDELKRDQRKLLEVIRARGGKISVRNLRRSSRSYQGDGVAKDALQGLVDIGWGQWQFIPAGTDGGRPSELFVLNNDSGDAKTPE